MARHRRVKGASTFVPIRETGINGQWTATMTWSSQPPAPADLTQYRQPGSPTAADRRHPCSTPVAQSADLEKVAWLSL
jgi:hypothetical protein